jgi:hypothetical protein
MIITFRKPAMLAALALAVLTVIGTAVTAAARLPATTPAAAAAPLPAATTATAKPKPRYVWVRGTQTPVNEAKGTYQMHGDLVGDWVFLTYVPLFQSRSMTVAEGTEQFHGCIDANHNARCGHHEPGGKLRFNFTYWASFNPKTGALIKGDCAHPITSGTGSFGGARGILTMHDVQVKDQVRTTYQGTVVLHAVASGVKAADPSAAAAASAGHALAASASSAGRGPC